MSGQTQIVSGSVYNLVSKTSGIPIDDGGSATAGTALQQNTATVGNPNQQWRINSLGGGVYQLICLSSGMALDTGGSIASGTFAIR
jgi:alpha-L-fucosidase